nr:tyrosinase family protein [Kibdelosporangium sp. MJ126-NF4]CEL16368.1 putative tyrosinase [Kibdelosporangium sp. MJ126-NF4]CTQ94292.1 putative tyrosinase [Kibdelosporangium sp. MJ126-NF4]
MGVRKNQQNLTAGEKTRLVDAMLAMKRSGAYDSFVRQHIERLNGDSDNGTRIGHRSPSFLPWHRKYLIEFERALQAVDSTVSLPYWDWTTAGARSTLWATDFMGPDGSRTQNGRVTGGPFTGTNWPLSVRSDSAGYLRRSLGSGGVTLPTAGDVRTVLGIRTYDTAPWNSTSSGSFRNSMEGFRGPNLHNRVHVWVNGTMAGAGSPNDPVFWLHHCHVDKLWSDWQAGNGRANYVPVSGTADVVDIDEPMEPWGDVTPRDMFDHTAVYTYE